MSEFGDISIDVTHHVRDTCLCLHAQRAARSLARRFDRALKPAGLNNGQFSLMMALNRPDAAPMGALSDLLAMDRTTLTAKLKPLVKRGLVTLETDKEDRRARRVRLTPAGAERLADALPIWYREHELLEMDVDGSADALRRGLQSVT